MNEGIVDGIDEGRDEDSNGDSEGYFEGDIEGCNVPVDFEGFKVVVIINGETDGCIVGSFVFIVGDCVLIDGIFVGENEGENVVLIDIVGVLVGRSIGITVGKSDGCSVGDSDG